MSRRSLRWLGFAAALVGSAALVGWKTGVLHEWTSYGQMALFRLSLTRELSRDGARWTVRSSANVRGELWTFYLDRDGAISAGVNLRFYPSSEAARDQFAKSGNAFVPSVLVAYVQGSPPPPVRFAQPIISHSSLPGLGQANFVWDADRGKNPAVVRFRQGPVVGLVDAGSLTDAEGVARKVAALISGRRY